MMRFVSKWREMSDTDITVRHFNELKAAVIDAIGIDNPHYREVIKVAIAAYADGLRNANNSTEVGWQTKEKYENLYNEHETLKATYKGLGEDYRNLQERYRQSKSVNEGLGEQVQELLNEQVNCASAEDCAKRLKELGYAGTLTKAEILNIGD